MKQIIASFTCGLFICFVLFINFNAFANQQEEEVTLIGFLKVSGWEEETVVEVALEVTFEEEDEEGELISFTKEYIIVNDEKGEQLFDLVGETVEVTGIIRQDADEIEYIRVNSYKIIDETEQ